MYVSIEINYFILNRLSKKANNLQKNENFRQLNNFEIYHKCGIIFLILFLENIKKFEIKKI